MFTSCYFKIENYWVTSRTCFELDFFLTLQSFVTFLLSSLSCYMTTSLVPCIRHSSVENILSPSLCMVPHSDPIDQLEKSVFTQSICIIKNHRWVLHQIDVRLDDTQNLCASILILKMGPSYEFLEVPPLHNSCKGFTLAKFLSEVQ